MTFRLDSGRQFARVDWEGGFYGRAVVGELEGVDEGVEREEAGEIEGKILGGCIYEIDDGSKMEDKLERD